MAGLGNPGSLYAPTRHNLGFMVADELARRLDIAWGGGKGDYLKAEGRGDWGGLVLLKPLTWMNGSGRAVAEAMGTFGLHPEDLLVVSDDAALPFGSLRMRPGGSGGAHNGLRSVIEHLGTEAFCRLRLGIRPPEGMPDVPLRAFVLSPFGISERAGVEAMVGRAAEGSLEFIRSGPGRAMTSVNT